MLKAGRFNTDKSQEMLDVYETWFGHLKNKKMALLELGVLNGGSLLLWSNYFKKGKIIGVDINHVDTPTSTRLKFYRGSQDDARLLSRIAKEDAPGGFDIIIDDASHIGALTKKSYEILFDRHLKKGGIYVIEDWGTGYWQAHLDGGKYSGAKNTIARLRGKNRFPSHDYGMVGFVKQLVDEVGRDDITLANLGTGEMITSKIGSMEIRRGQLALFKK